MIDSITGLDHVVVNVAERMDAVADAYRRLGFQLTPRGFHSLGTINHLIIFQHDYLELLGYPPGQPPAGLSALVEGELGLVAGALASRDATRVHRQAQAAHIPVFEPLDFSRPVALPDGEREAAFRVTRLDPDFTAGMALFVCEHRTPELVWRPEWQDHPNGVTAIAFVSVVVPDPVSAVKPYTRLFGEDGVQPMDGGVRLDMGQVRLELIDAAALARRAPDLGPDTRRTAYPAILGLRVRDLDTTARYLRDQGITVHETDNRLQVGTTEAGGVILAFEA